LETGKLPEAKCDFALLHGRWILERSLAWATRCRRLVKDDGRLSATLAGLHVAASAGVMLRHAADLAQVHKTL